MRIAIVLLLTIVPSFLTVIEAVYRKPDFCYDPPIPGIATCYGYFYNKTSEKCQELLYGGCLETKNHFKSLTECNLICGSTELKPALAKRETVRKIKFKNPRLDPMCLDRRCATPACRRERKPDGCIKCNCKTVPVEEACRDFPCPLGAECIYVNVTCNAKCGVICHRLFYPTEPVRPPIQLPVEPPVQVQPPVQQPIRPEVQLPVQPPFSPPFHEVAFRPPYPPPFQPPIEPPFQEPLQPPYPPPFHEEPFEPPHPPPVPPPIFNPEIYPIYEIVW